MAIFKITGEQVTEAARDLVVSGDWRRALALLTEDIEGLAYLDALAILKGDKRMAGSGDEMALSLEDQNVRQTYCEEVKSVYLDGRLSHNQGLYKVYGKVTRLPSSETWEWQDAKKRISLGMERFPLVKDKKETDLREFVRGYCRDMYSDLILQVRDKLGRPECVYVLLTPCFDNTDRPSWMTHAITSDPQEAFDSMGGCIMEYGPIPLVESAAPVAAAAIEKAMGRSQDSVKPTHVEAHETLQKLDIFTSMRRDSALAIARDHGFDSTQAFSASLRTSVMQAISTRGDTWESLVVPRANGLTRTIRFPKGLATTYALSRTTAAHLAPKWEPVSGHDLKMANDSRAHTDLWLALGNDLDGDEYEHATDANMDLGCLVTHIQKEKLSYELHVLTAAGKEVVQGVVVNHDDPDVINKVAKGNAILLIPHAGEEYAVLAAKSVAVLCRAGGKLAHLVIVGRETGIPVVRIPEGSKPILTGVLAWLYLTQGRIEFSAAPGLGDF